MKPPLDAALFRRAARLIEKDVESYCCNALFIARYRSRHSIPEDGWWDVRDAMPEVKWFTRLYRPADPAPVICWYESYPTVPDTRCARIIGLCLAAELVEDEDFSL